MGIVNVTPDSFSDGGQFLETQRAVARALDLVAAGADIIDIGGESTRPGAEPVSAEIEANRVLPVIKALRSQTQALISVDTFKASVASESLAVGADIINDITGLRGDPDMLRVAAASDCGIVIMHMQGRPRTMQTAPSYDDVVTEVSDFFQERLQKMAESGIDLRRVAVDPGIGFGKLLAHNLQLLRATPQFVNTGQPVLIGASRKSFIGQVLDSKQMSDRMWPTIAVTSLTREMGATIHRVHDVATCTQALRMTEAIMFGHPALRS